MTGQGGFAKVPINQQGMQVEIKGNSHGQISGNKGLPFSLEGTGYHDRFQGLHFDQGGPELPELFRGQGSCLKKRERRDIEIPGREA